MYGNGEYGRTEYGGLPITSNDFVQVCSDGIDFSETLAKKGTFVRALTESLKITEVVMATLSANTRK